LKLESRGF
jgi:hypothetical protein